MARIFITGSADGLGQMAATQLIRQGHNVVLHARNAARAQHAISKVPGAVQVLVGDLSSMEETKKLAASVNALGAFDAIIHNAGVYQEPGHVILTVNTLAPYILTCLIQKPGRLVYLSSGMHRQGDASLRNLMPGTSGVTYSDSKLHDLLLTTAVARKWPTVYANAVDPGWVPTRMGGKGAPDNLDKGVQTQVWLAVSDDEKAKVSGRYFYHQREANHRPEAEDVKLQDTFLARCEEITGVGFPAEWP